MTYVVILLPGASRQFLRLTRPIQERLRPPIDSLAINPRPPGVKKLKGGAGYWRIRVGDYRIIYTIQDDRLIVTVVRIGNRRDAYR